MSWRPFPGAQEEFLRRREFEVLFGGAAGPGKTDCLVAALTRDVNKPTYHGLIVRRTFPQLQEVIDRCHRLYPYLGGVFRSTEKRWHFPSGAVIDLGHMQHETDKYNYQGKEYHRIGVDELTQFTETQYTYLFSRLRTVDPDIIPQILSTTNPGGIGHYWVKDRFVTITDHGKTYLDPKSGLSRVFIPATIEDNPALFLNDPAYLARLEALPEIEKMRLRHGIWDSFEGQVFPELSARVHGVEPFDIPPEWERYCVLDWGYAKPFSVGWYAMDYDGILYRYREYYGCKEGENDVGLKMSAYEVAREILNLEKGEKIRMRVADPSIWHPRPETRRTESRGPTINEDMASEGVFFLKADNDRLQGKMQVHKRLKIEEEVNEETGEILSEHPLVRVFNSNKHFWRIMPNMQEDSRNPEDVDCWVAGTLISTPGGDRFIEDIEIGDLVNTPIGPRRVIKTYLSGLSETIYADLSNGLRIEGTPRHKVYVRNSGLVRLDNVKCHDTLIGEFHVWKQRLLFIVASSLGVIQGGGITSRAEMRSMPAGHLCTDKFGLIQTALSQLGCTYTTKTTTLKTIQSKTLRLCLLVLTPCTTIWTGVTFWKNKAHGQSQKKDAPYSRTISGNAERVPSRKHLRAAIVGSLLRLDTLGRNTAHQNVAGRKTISRLKNLALFVAMNFGLSLTKLKKSKHVHIVAVGRSERKVPVYNLTVDDAHLFYANGILSSNTDQEDHIYDEFRYMCMARPVKPKKVERIPRGSFMAERNKMIRAKQYAQRHGVSIDVAYSRTR